MPLRIAWLVVLLLGASAHADETVEALRNGSATVAGEPYVKTVRQLVADIVEGGSRAHGVAIGTLRRLNDREAVLLPSAFDEAAGMVPVRPGWPGGPGGLAATPYPARARSR